MSTNENTITPAATVEVDGQGRAAVNLKEAARMLGVSERTLYTWSKCGKIRARRVGRKVLFPVAEIRRFLDAND